MTENQKKLFLEALSQHGIVTEAAAYAGVARSSVYRCRNLDQNFASSWSDAKEAATDRLAKAALDRALDGIEEVKYFKGEPLLIGALHIGKSKQKGLRVKNHRSRSRRLLRYLKTSLQGNGQPKFML